MGEGGRGVHMYMWMCKQRATSMQVSGTLTCVPRQQEDVSDAAPRSGGVIPIRNRDGDQAWARYAEIVSPDALALVRFGLRDPNDLRIVNTVRVIDETLRTHTATGPAWYRYNRDGYGEKEDGSPFDGTGVGRPWPLLAGERAQLVVRRRRHARFHP